MYVYTYIHICAPSEAEGNPCMVSCPSATYSGLEHGPTESSHTSQQDIWKLPQQGNTNIVGITRNDPDFLATHILGPSCTPRVASMKELLPHRTTRARLCVKRAAQGGRNVRIRGSLLA